MPNRKSDRVCDVADCSRKHEAKGYCKRHYRAWRTHGDPMINLKSGRRICVVDGCEAYRSAGGLCHKHYLRQRRGSPLDAPDRMFRHDGCDVEGCDRPHWSWGLCKFHDHRKRQGKNLTDPIRVLSGGSPYANVHNKVRAQRGKASEHVCAHCGRPALHWAYDHRDPNVKREVFRNGAVRVFSESTEHYIPLCVLCHRAFDAKQVLR